jgi:hypothetical protein
MDVAPFDPGHPPDYLETACVTGAPQWNVGWCNNYAIANHTSVSE